MPRMKNAEKLVETVDLSKYFNVGKAVLKAVDGVSIFIYKGETLGLVGESGCGKTTCGRTILKLYEATAGKVYYKNEDITGRLRRDELINFKRSAQVIFQDPYSSLDPRMTIGEIIQEGMEVHFKYSQREKQQKTNDLLDKVGLTSDHASRFAHELSGGQRQRVGIARALAVEPEFIVCDEPIASLDVSIQAQIVNLLINLQKEQGLTYLFISHDLSMVRYISDRIGVMYLGSIVEMGTSQTIFTKPLHPYTKALLSAIPTADPDFETKRQRIRLEGEVPSPVEPPSGCKFRTRCFHATKLCTEKEPEFIEIEAGHFVACHHI